MMPLLYIALGIMFAVIGSVVWAALIMAGEADRHAPPPPAGRDSAEPWNLLIRRIKNGGTR